MYLVQPAIINIMTRLAGESLTDRAPDTLGVDFHKQILRRFPWTFMVADSNFGIPHSFVLGKPEQA